jgi:hypothetical protein
MVIHMVLSMTNENYRKCKTCRFCIHTGEKWVCSLKSTMTEKEGTCERYRPGCCENCVGLVLKNEMTMCSITGSETDILSVCSDYDPCGRRSV